MIGLLLNEKEIFLFKIINCKTSEKEIEIAAAMGDIGHLFPDTDDKWKGADSLKLLEEVVRQVNAKGYKIVNIDSTILAQVPKMAPYIYSMRENIANACNIDVDLVSVKATTEEGLGFTGSKKGIAAHAVCLVDCY